MRKLILLFAAIALVVAATAAGTASAGDPPAHAAATKTVTIGDNFFSPKTLKVRKGTIVQWVWGPDNSGTAVEHNVTGAKGNRFASEDTMKPDKPFRKRITRTTNVICTIHPTTMKLKITVK
jgi:plastocyanin